MENQMKVDEKSLDQEWVNLILDAIDMGIRLSPYNCVKRKVIIMIRVTMFSTKKTINGGHDDDPNQYYYKL
ncbi:hypothetical protein HV449_20020, partial [Bacillus sporothermodurans]|uniref:anti-repressor SinI family protein n=1 Tax=Heyndrickxia sporothermodurans TaxID=46224 RepID=UPI00192BB3E8